MSKILAIDLGTTYLKMMLYDRDSGTYEVRRFDLPLRREPVGRLELSTDAFADVLLRGFMDLRNHAAVGLADVEAITFATQTNSFVLLDADHRPLTPLILWPDVRAAELESEVQKRCGFPEFSAATGVPQLNRQFMAAKLLWLQRHDPNLFKQTAKLCLIGDYLTYLLTGRHVTEAGTAGLTGLVDVHRCRWWSVMLERFDLNASWLPAIARAGADLGVIAPAAARRFGLPESCRCVVGCLDQYAGAIGTGSVEPGMISETTGTVLATVQCTDRFTAQPGPAVFQGPAFREGLYWRMTFGDVSANYLEWYRNQLPDRPDFAQLAALAARTEPGAAGLKLRTDVGMTRPEEVLQGLTADHTRGQAVRCIFEAVARALGEQVAALCGGKPPGEIRCAGGGARSDAWLQIKADLLGATMTATECSEPTSLGAVILAEASLRGTDVPQVARQWVRLKPPHHPR
ncbi:MAG: FGGY-family carbohydrate kinase [Pirellulales bacterium]|nr:FGGY-family carbohydrate kinase [Pirellulales bacterium]